MKKIFNIEIFKFFMVGVINTVIGLGITFVCLNIFQLSYWVSTFFGNLIGACVSYFLNKNLTFKSKISNISGIPKFIMTILLAYFLAYSISLYVVKQFLYIVFPRLEGFWIDNVAVLLGMILYTIFNYLGLKFLVFTKWEKEIL